MAENEMTTMRVSWKTKKRFRGYAKHPRATDEATLVWILDKLQELDEEIVELNKKLEHKKEDY